MRPRIGITTSTLPPVPNGPTAVSAATHLAYVHCVYQAGGLPLLLPNLPDVDAEAVLASLDGLLLSGGGDIDPVYWHEAPHPALGLVDPARDAFETALVRAALRRDLPLLGICRGVQVMAVATGGDLWQDLPSQCSGGLCHRQTTLRAETSHTVAVEAHSLLARVLWPNVTIPAQSHVVAVNSFHHQAPRACGIVFSAIASSPDGIIEGLVAPDATFALGVQWHPEEMVASDPVHARLFSALIDAARG